MEEKSQIKVYTQNHTRCFGRSNAEKEIIDTMKTDGSSKQNAVKMIPLCT